MSKFLTLHYYFDTTPGSDFRYWLVFAVFGASLLLVSFLISFFRKRMSDKILKKMLRKYPIKLFWYGIMALFLVWVRKEDVQLLSMRFFWIIYFVLFFRSIFVNIKIFFHDYPRKVKQSLLHKKQNQYIPSRKKKGRK